MKKLIVFAVLLLGPAMTQQAAACDMGAIETWVASACNGQQVRNSTDHPAAGSRLRWQQLHQVSARSVEGPAPAAAVSLTHLHSRPDFSHDPIAALGYRSWPWVMALTGRAPLSA